MTEADNSCRKDMSENDEISFLAVGSVLLRHRRLILVLGTVGACVALAMTLASPRLYQSTALFQPQAMEAGAARFAQMASRIGLPVATTGGEWGPQVYLKLLETRGLLEPIARDTFFVAEMGGQSVALMDLLRIKAPNPELKLDRTLQRLSNIIRCREIQTIGAVEVSVRTYWPSVSLTLTERLVQALNRFNLETRKSHAAEERVFVSAQAQEAEQALLQAENTLLSFLQNNRTIAGSPELTFEHDRLKRAVNLRQAVYTSLVQHLEDARIREVRDTPVITMLEIPKLASSSQPRRTLLKTLLGGVLGGFLGILTAFQAEIWYRACKSENATIRQFVALVHESTPGFLRRFLS